MDPLLSHLASRPLLRRLLFARTAERNAHERCRRFDTAALDLSPAEALLHVQDRTEDLAQTRPEYGNGTNAMCFVGRRSRIRGLYLDRRSFLMSYDPTTDDSSSGILARILAAVIPVCEGINMLYTLSAMDSSGWGSGTKLPHNVTSLLGVMDGAASDLRTGLPWQGVDIHEPVRLLFVIETTPESMLKIIEENPTVGRICRNGWAQLAVLDPQSSTIRRFNGREFVPYEPMTQELPEASSSVDWYRGWRDHLGFAQIVSDRFQESPAC
ncbi:MAG: putative inorganic carbon transporter subunit DabA [Phycisphaerae bacterium]